MNKFLIMLLLVSSTAGQAQVTLEKGKLVREGQSYSFSDYRIVFQNEEARRLLKKARGHGTTGTILGGIGGGLIGAGLASAITKREKVYYVNNIKYTENTKNGAAWSLVGIGAGIVGIGIPFAISSNKNAKKALETENGTDTAYQPHFRIESAGNGIALNYIF